MRCHLRSHGTVVETCTSAEMLATEIEIEKSSTATFGGKRSASLVGVCISLMAPQGTAGGGREEKGAVKQAVQFYLLPSLSYSDGGTAPSWCDRLQGGRVLYYVIQRYIHCVSPRRGCTGSK